MGFMDALNKLTRADADGTRKAMRKTYRNHLRSIEQGRLQIPEDDSPHQSALYGALGTRYMTLGFSADEMRSQEIFLWLELMPFLYLEPSTAVEALAEYVVWKEPETKHETKATWLYDQIREGVQKASEEIGEDILENASSSGVPWAALNIFGPRSADDVIVTGQPMSASREDIEQRVQEKGYSLAWVECCEACIEGFNSAELEMESGAPVPEGEEPRTVEEVMGDFGLWEFT